MAYSKRLGNNGLEFSTSVFFPGYARQQILNIFSSEFTGGLNMASKGIESGDEGSSGAPGGIFWSNISGDG